MAVYIDSAGRLHHDQESGLALQCPHCQVLAHISPLSVPDFNVIQQHKPSQVGLVYRCESCNAPVFLRFPVKLYAGSRVELAPNFVELERARERFNFTYLPEDTEALLKEAFACFTAACYNAFASMCRRVAQSDVRRPRCGRQARALRRAREHPPARGARRRIIRGRPEGAVRNRPPGRATCR